MANTTPDKHLVFACDNAAFPYGTFDEHALLQRVIQVVESLIQTVTPDLVIIACNTASTLVLEPLRQRFDIPIVGVVPAIKPAAKLTKTGVIGLLATPATVRRPYTDKLVDDFAQGHTVIRIGSADLVYAAEQKLRGDNIDTAVLHNILTPFREAEELDTIVLACTHFPLLLDELKSLLPSHIAWVDSAAAIARRVSSLLPKTTEDIPIHPTKMRCPAYVTAEDNSLSKIQLHSHRLQLDPVVVLEL